MNTCLLRTTFVGNHVDIVALARALCVHLVQREPVHDNVMHMTFCTTNSNSSEAQELGGTITWSPPDETLITGYDVPPSVVRGKDHFSSLLARFSFWPVPHSCRCLGSIRPLASDCASIQLLP